MVVKSAVEESRDDENILDFDTCTNFNRLVAKEGAKEAKVDIAPPLPQIQILLLNWR